MTSKQDIVRISKFVSLILRHKPETVGLQLDSQGWVGVDQLILAINQAEFPPTEIPLTRETLETVVATNNKKRFIFSEDGTLIRANQGHSIPINLGLDPQVPPQILYHGTAKDTVPLIQADGLLKMNRQHVHLSKDPLTAHQVGQRHGKPVVLEILAEKMHEAGHSFYCSENGVWLTSTVPVEYIDFS